MIQPQPLAELEIKPFTETLAQFETSSQRALL